MMVATLKLNSHKIACAKPRQNYASDAFYRMILTRTQPTLFKCQSVQGLYELLGMNKENIINLAANLESNYIQTTLRCSGWERERGGLQVTPQTRKLLSVYCARCSYYIMKPRAAKWYCHLSCSGYFFFFFEQLSLNEDVCNGKHNNISLRTLEPCVYVCGRSLIVFHPHNFWGTQHEET